MIVVTPVNDPPYINVTDTLTYYYGDVLEIDLSPFVSDIDNDISDLTISVLENDNIGTTVSGLQVTFYGINNWVGEDSLTIYVDDNAESIRNQQRRYLFEKQRIISKRTATFSQATSAKDSRTLPSDRVAITVNLSQPGNLTFENVDNGRLLSWRSVPASDGYLIFSSPEPDMQYSDWFMETVNPVADTCWIDTCSVSRNFFYVVAINGEYNERIRKDRIPVSASNSEFRSVSDVKGKHLKKHPYKKPLKPDKSIISKKIIETGIKEEIQNEKRQ